MADRITTVAANNTPATIIAVTMASNSPTTIIAATMAEAWVLVDRNSPDAADLTVTSDKAAALDSQGYLAQRGFAPRDGFGFADGRFGQGFGPGFGGGPGQRGFGPGPGAAFGQRGFGSGPGPRFADRNFGPPNGRMAGFNRDRDGAQDVSKLEARIDGLEHRIDALLDQLGKLQQAPRKITAQQPATSRLRRLVRVCPVRLAEQDPGGSLCWFPRGHFVERRCSIDAKQWPQGNASAT